MCRSAASLRHEQWTDQGCRIARFHLVLLLFDELLDDLGDHRHGRTRPAAAAGGDLGALPRPNELATRHAVGDPRQDDLPAPPGAGQGGAGQEGRQEAGEESQRQQVQQDVIDVVDVVDDDDLLEIDGVRDQQSCVAGRLGLPTLPAALSADGGLGGHSGLDGVDAMAAAVVAAGPLAGAALSLLLDAILPAARWTRTTRTSVTTSPETTV